MYTIVTILIIIVCVLLALAVLVQNSKGGGLAAGFASSNQIMGVRKTTDFLEKLTWGLAIGLFCLTLLGTFLLPDRQRGPGSSAIEEQIQNAPVPAQNMPSIPQQGTEPAPVQPQGQE